MKKYLLIIDPQNDFCKPDGALSVVGADKDMERLATFVEKQSAELDDILVTLDCHLPLHIAHATMWEDIDGNPPTPFTLITQADIISGKWRTKKQLMFNPPGQTERIPWAKYYTSKLEEDGKYTLCIWPEHCLIGSNGAAVYPKLFETLNNWQRERFAIVTYITKGENYLTESYSALKAEVEDIFDPSTKLNTELISILEDPEVSEVIIAGEALSHCVASTVTDLVNNLSKPENIQKFVLLEDCCSNVTGFENLGDTFIKNMKDLGMKITTSVDYLK